MPIDFEYKLHLCSACGAPMGVGSTWATQRFKVSPQMIEWCNNYRATSEVQYQLSGVAYRNVKERNCEIPIDEEATESVFLDCTCQLTFPCLRKGRHGFFIHIHCWNMIKRLIGPLAEERLDLLVIAMRERWTAYPDAYGLGTELLVTDSEWGPYRYLGYWYCNRARHPDRYRHRECLVPLTDPTRVPTLKGIVDRSKKRITRTRMSARIPAKLRLAHLEKIPLDLRMLILDELPGLGDVVNAATAFCWQMPGAYWKSRRTAKMIFEADGLSADDFDWQYLLVEFVRLSKSSYAFENRERITGILEGTRDMFFEALEREKLLKN